MNHVLEDGDHGRDSLYFTMGCPFPTIVADRQTDSPTDYATPSVIIGRIYVHSTAMRHNNILMCYMLIIIMLSMYVS